MANKDDRFIIYLLCLDPRSMVKRFTTQSWVKGGVALDLPNAGLATERAGVRIPFATVSRVGHFHSLHDAPVCSAVGPYK